MGGTLAFFRLGLAPAGYEFITGAEGPGYATGKQLAFASVGGNIVLFSHSTGSGEMGHVDLDFGTVTPVFTSSKFTDLTSATRCEDLLNPVINIKPYSWPNAVNACSQGATPVIIWGSNTLDVTKIDFSSMTLGADGDGNGGGVKGVGKDGNRLLCTIEDVGSPDLSPSCLNVEGCDGIGPEDGIADLSCKFDTYGMHTTTTTDGSTTTAEVCFYYAGDKICVEQEIKLTCDPAAE